MISIKVNTATPISRAIFFRLKSIITDNYIALNILATLLSLSAISLPAEYYMIQNYVLSMQLTLIILNFISTISSPSQQQYNNYRKRQN